MGDQQHCRATTRHPSGESIICSGRVVERQGYRDGRPSVQALGSQLDRPAHPLQQRLTDGQAQPEPAVPPPVRGVGLAELLEECLLVFGSDTNAGVVNDHCDAIRAFGRCGVYQDPALLGELDRITENVHEHLPESSPVRVYRRQVRGKLRGERQSLAHSLDIESADDFLRQVLQVDPLQPDVQLPRFDPRNVESHVLLAPEGVLVLNRTGATILRLCDGERTVEEIVEELRTKYDRVSGDEVGDFIGKLAARRWVVLGDG